MSQNGAKIISMQRRAEKLLEESERLKCDCIIVGGCANGLLLREVWADAEGFELSRPEYIKPIASTLQKVPEVAKLKDTYVLHPLGLVNDDGKKHLFAIAVVEGQSLTWAFSQLVISHVENVTRKLLDAGIIHSEKKHDG